MKSLEMVLSMTSASYLGRAYANIGSSGYFLTNTRYPSYCSMDLCMNGPMKLSGGFVMLKIQKTGRAQGKEGPLGVEGERGWGFIADTCDV